MVSLSVRVMQAGVAVLGSDGQLGRCLRDCVPGNLRQNFHFFTRADADLSRARETDALLGRVASDCDILVNCAACVDVAGIESKPEIAARSEQVNHLLPARLARKLAGTGALLIHFSTEYVFGHGHTSPWRPQDECQPLNVYGSHKRAGELAILESGARALIIRTSWLYSEYGKNFVRTILRVGRERDHLDIVEDEIGSPSYAGDLAAATMKIIASDRLRTITAPEIFHYCNDGSVSRCDFGREIIRLARAPARVRPITSAQYGSKVSRPLHGVMDNSRIKEYFSVAIPHWRDSLLLCMQRMPAPASQSGDG